MDYQNMRVEELKAELIVDAKKGYPFLLTGVFYWLVMGSVGFFIDNHQCLALCYLIGLGSIFPLALAISNIVKANILTKNLVVELGGIVGEIQIFYLIIWG